MLARLSADLRRILDGELARGNTVELVSYPDGGVFVIMRDSFWIADADLPRTVERWEIDDAHHADGCFEGYRSTDTEHVVVYRRRSTPSHG